MSYKVKGIILTTILAFFVVFIFFGKIIQNPNEFCFSADGDGFKAYYGAMYHVQHDSTFMRMNGMNYPYGEMVFFTGCQPLVANAIKLFSTTIFDIGDNVVGIMNLLMIFSIVIAALCMFLIFYELDVDWVFASVVAAGICMLSPQLARFGGHFSLSWMFWIPLMLWLVIRFDKKPNYLRALVIGCVTFLAGAMHMYFIAFYGFIIGLYLLGQLLHKNRKFGLLKGVIFFFIQYVFPVILFQLIISVNDPVTDRTAFPYGFWAYMGNPLGVFLPYGKPYSWVPRVITAFRHVSWESFAFIGMSALFGFCIGVFYFFRKLFKKKNPFNITDQFISNILFWASFVALLFSFGLPFKFGFESLVDQLGPLRQLRALARFSWLFFYMLNIVVFYSLYKKIENSGKNLIWIGIGTIAILFLLYDGAWNTWINSRSIQNEKPLLTDVNNELPANKWVNEINPEDYQAILPLPYFHVGSENIWIESQQNTQELTMLASLKTGLPTTGVQLSRTSIGQTYKNYALVTEPLEPFKILSDLPSGKPFLLLFNRKHYATPEEERLIKAGDLLYQDEFLELRKLSVEKLEGLHDQYLKKIESEIKGTQLYKKGNYLMTDSAKMFIHKTFDDASTEHVFYGAGALQYPGEHWKVVLEDTLNLAAGKKYKLSFWMSDYKEDGRLRTVVEFVQRDGKTKEVSNYFYSDAHRHIKGFQNEWALIELNFETKTENEVIKLAIRNTTLKNETLVIDELIIREEDLDVYYPASDVKFKNGRKLPF
ncbi:hypothetical protein SLH46_04180 [Draconibacterium sp. IB214405]|uniref:hypothetical protein n=1 Tax=Draconibacterium sp. IB214405 TaxID=3097352 RepID=UPI002A0DE6ED|nr:hypothetical protein [Draconibacterium sp. IB214405]MDX8338369.1 hypothetical protein [Draconibacterium sp. IB214405]